MTDGFYNTIDLESRELSEARLNALNQEQRILRHFIQGGRGLMMAPSYVQSKVFARGVPLTSVRRAMTSLTNRGDLVKSTAKKRGPYGKPEHLWTIAAKWDRAAAPMQGELL